MKKLASLLLVFSLMFASSSVYAQTPILNNVTPEQSNTTNQLSTTLSKSSYTNPTEATSANENTAPVENASIQAIAQVNVESTSDSTTIQMPSSEQPVDAENPTSDVSDSPISSEEAPPIQQVTVPQKLTDIDAAFWAKDEVMQLIEMGVISGYPDGEFRAALPINRGQAANLFTGVLKLPVITYQSIFADVSSKSSFSKGVMATYAANIFAGKPDGKFGVADALTREQMASTIVRAFRLQDTGAPIIFTDWYKISESHRENVKILAQHGITTGRADGSFDPKATINRATFTVMLHRALVATNQLTKKSYTIIGAQKSTNFKLFKGNPIVVKVTDGDNPLYIRSNASITLKNISTKAYGIATDKVYMYAVHTQGATFTITVRTLKNGDQLIFSTLKNPASKALTVELFQKEQGVTNTRLYRYDRFPIEKKNADVFGYDLSTYPTGVFRFMGENGLLADRMVGQAYRSKQLTLNYPNGGNSYMRDLVAEYEALSYVWMGTDIIEFYNLTSNGQDIVDHWYMASSERLFETDENMNSYMLETAINYKKRNKWYTAEGPFNKMAVTTEPMPASNQGFGRNLLLVKEDRALVLYKQQGDRYFANLLKNAFVSLEKFKGDKTYWQTEVTSTYLKSLYNINAPFIDTRFNEQIALFYYNAGVEFEIPNYTTPLKNYANLLVSRKEAGHIIPVNSDAYYISDYFPINQQAVTHSSMNHMLGGMNLLLIAYKQFGDVRYLQTATSIQNAIALEKDKWIRDDGDIWYRVGANGQFVGRDYQHLTLEDLINAYALWKDIDPAQLPVIEQLIASKAGYLSANNLGYTVKIKKGFEELDMLKYLPNGPMYTDAK